MSCLDDLKDFYGFYGFYDFYGFNDLPLTADSCLLSPINSDTRVAGTKPQRRGVLLPLGGE